MTYVEIKSNYLAKLKTFKTKNPVKPLEKAKFIKLL